ncbi:MULTISPECIES: cell division protein ZapE [unclassified Oceanobacter]|uniref:cell division protein ZapE n=1 Tax=unclassified Oceanobacter TaxID=2620260 RepID=UPI0026E1B72C|nr:MULTISPECIES: cell division protein ZapE [unclassified Oceanobacter]MDO6682768.1 cell division protein ZapE [Oceanobacter sp. 5_MG-2023]MDP2504840.1 cell division protein ZapE [Oceanobacter sp. 3_MG-2023]MDP2546284.1 cell division protein ZapE [Oceanobacter sp. 4_MG-2023]MDP2607585.1 cell division protein ZapE [Oceanobacter sp. 1_MG-2023]MDP2610853.1 cell division protein ZapE [Oceanobacter sp. 2_MG-2023]
MSTPWELYQADLQRDDFSYDAAQEMAVKHLQRLFDDLVAAEARRANKGFVGKLGSKFSRKKPEPVQGLYFWGGVGRGKTYLVDTFYEALPFERKMRTHFHRFMQRVHQDLTKLAGTKNPLTVVADRIAEEAVVICFDEFFVSDIGDAMILGSLMQELFDRGVTLVSTSNIVPDGLYKNGLQRDRFIPAIKLLNKYTDVVNVDSGVDYRLRTLEQAELYHYPLDDSAEASLQKSFDSLAPDMSQVEFNVGVEVLGREIPAKAVCNDVGWFEFDALCDGPRSQNDYIELGKQFHALLISNVPVMSVKNDDLARRFINLIDEFYDRGVKVIMSAGAAIPDIYEGGKLEFEFQRTTSRMLEMQSHEYLTRECKID